MKQIHDAIERRANNFLRQDDLTLTQVWVLLSLNYMENKTCCLKDMEKILNVAQSTCVGIINRLVQKGLIDCFTSANDKRIKIIRLTETGEKRCSAAEKSRTEIDNLLFRGLSEKEAEAFIKTLRKIYDNVK